MPTIQVNTNAIKDAAPALGNLYPSALRVIRSAYRSSGESCEVDSKDLVAFVRLLQVGLVPAHSFPGIFAGIGKVPEDELQLPA